MGWTIIGQGGSGGGGSEATPLLVSGAPFLDPTALDTWSQANPLELFNNSSQYATAFITGDETYRWEGVDQVYSADSWVQTSAGLTPSEADFVDSGVNMPDNEIPVMGEGAASGQFISRGFAVDDDNKKVDLNGYSLVVGTQSVEYGGALLSEVAGHTLALTDAIDNEVTHAVSQTFEDGYTAFERVRTTLAPIQISDKTADLVNPTWSQTANINQTVKQVVVDFTNAVTNFRVQLEISGIVVFDRNLGDFPVGESAVVLVPPVDVRLNDITTFILTSNDGDVTVKGNSGTGIPYQVATIASWVDELIGGVSGDVTGPASSIDTELALFDSTTGKLLEGGSQITAAVGSTDANLVVGTSSALGSGSSSIEFQDSGAGYLANISYDEADFQLEIASDAGIDIGASTDLYLSSNGVFEIQNSASDIEITANGDIALSSDNVTMTLPSMTIGATTNGFTLTPTSNAAYGFGFNGDSSISQSPITDQLQISSASGDMLCQVLNGFSMDFSAAQDATFSAVLGDISITGAGTATFEAGLSIDMSSSDGILQSTSVTDQFPISLINSGIGGVRVDHFVRDSNPEGLLTALNGSICLVVDELIPSNTKEYRLKATGTGLFNTPWVEVGGSGDGDVVGPVSSIVNELSVFKSVDGEQIGGGTLITADIGFDSLLQLGTSQPTGVGSPSVQFNDSNGNYLANVGYDEADFGLEVQSDDGINISASGDFYVQGSGVFQLNNVGGNIDITSNGDLNADCDNFYLESSLDVDIKSTLGNVTIESTSANYSVISGGNISQLSSGTASHTSTGDFNVLSSSDILLTSFNGLQVSKTGGSLDLPVATFSSNGSNGGTSKYNVSNSTPANVRAGTSEDMVHSTSTDFDSANIFVYNGNDNSTGWVGCAGGPSVLSFGNLNVQSGTTTRYLQYGCNQQDQAVSDIDYAKTRSPRSGIAQRLTVCHGDPAGNGNDINYTLMVGGVASALTLNVASNSSTGTTSTTRVSISRGDEIAIRVTKALGISSSPKNVTVNLDLY